MRNAYTLSDVEIGRFEQALRGLKVAAVVTPPDIQMPVAEGATPVALKAFLDKLADEFLELHRILCGRTNTARRAASGDDADHATDIVYVLSRAEMERAVAVLKILHEVQLALPGGLEMRLEGSPISQACTAVVAYATNELSAIHRLSVERTKAANVVYGRPDAGQ